MRSSIRLYGVLALLGLYLFTAAPAQAGRRDSGASKSKSTSTSKSKSDERRSKRGEAREKKKAAAPAKRTSTKAPRKTTRTRGGGGDTSLRGRFAAIPAPKVPGAARLRLELKPAAGDGRSGRVFRKSKLKSKSGGDGTTFKEKVMASTRKQLRQQ